MAGKKELRDLWEAKRMEWRRQIAVVKTRGFWCVQVVWFVAGGIFFRLLPARSPGAELGNYLLNQLLIIVIMLPIYFSAVMKLPERINRLILKYQAWKDGKPPSSTGGQGPL